MPLGDWDGSWDAVTPIDDDAPPPQPTEPQAPTGTGEGQGEGGEEPDFRTMYKRKDRENRKLRARIGKIEEQIAALSQGPATTTSYQGYAPAVPQHAPPVAGVPTPMSSGGFTPDEQQLIAQWQQIAREDSDKQVEAFTMISQIQSQAAARQAQQQSLAAYESRMQAERAWAAAKDQYPDVADRNSELFQLANEIFTEEMSPYQQQDPEAQFVAVERAAGRLGYRKGSKKAVPPKPPTPPSGTGGPTEVTPSPQRVITRDDLTGVDKGKRRVAIDAMARSLAAQTGGRNR